MSDQHNKPSIYDPVPPLSRSEEIYWAVTRGLISMFPIGSFLLEFAPALMGKRVKHFFRKADEGLNELIANGAVTPEEFLNNEVFATVLFQATQIAVRVHEEEKIEALRNALLNTAIENNVFQETGQLFLNQIETFTIWHLRLLRLFDSNNWLQQITYSLSQDSIEKNSKLALDDISPIWTEVSSFQSQIIKDLSSRGLIEIVEVFFIGGGIKIYLPMHEAPLTTELGRLFVQFIETPIQ